ncbi:MAG: translation initiation factor IF-2 N-terminal domain-containing protein, partial [Acidobacteria bacterium]|nr:translation initiation factor IF-2 N-terminal domain-containing protein [Acidobacteriota bacterium]
MSKIRINDLARELEVKSKAILDVLPEVGVTEKKTHSSSLEDYEAEKVRAHFQGSGDGHSAKAAKTSRPEAEGIKPKIDLSHISKPGDVLKAILAKQQSSGAAPTPPPPAKPAPPPAQEAKPAAPAVKPAAPAPSAPSAPAAPQTPPRA